MLIVRLALLFLLILLSTLAVVPAIADEKATVGEVTFECIIMGSDKDGFSLHATNHGKTDKKCTASCTLTKKDGSTETCQGESTVYGDSPVMRYICGKSSVKGPPLSNPEVKASCE